MIDAARYLIVACSLLSVLIGAPQWRRWMHAYPPEVLQGRLALAALTVAVGYNTVESLWRGIPGGPRTYVSAVGALWALYTVAWHPVATAHRRLIERTRPCPPAPLPRGPRTSTPQPRT